MRGFASSKLSVRMGRISRKQCPTDPTTQDSRDKHPQSSLRALSSFGGLRYFAIDVQGPLGMNQGFFFFFFFFILLSDYHHCY